MTDELAELFAERHAYFAWSLRSLEERSSGAERFAAFSDLTSALTAHLRSVDRATNPALRRFGLTDDHLKATFAAYGTVGLALAHMMIALRSSEGFDNGFAALATAVDVMCRIEREFVLPALGMYLGPDERVDIALDMQDMFEEHVGVVGVEGLTYPAARAASH